MDRQHPGGSAAVRSIHELDLIFVVYLKHKVRHRPRHNSLFGTIHMVVDEQCGGHTGGEEHLMQWARSRWEASVASSPAGRT